METLHSTNRMEGKDLIYKEESYQIIGACMEVHKELGPGFLEPVYQEALSYELGSRNIPFEKEKALKIGYKGKVLEKTYIADFVCFDKIILELKALKELLPEHESQVLNYLKATAYRLGLLVNFGCRSLTYRRLVF
ncbi:MAG: GxxExxY protein [Candidatus Kryptoniota bacterium]